MNRYACILIGPDRIELICAQRGAGRKVKILDHAYYPIELDYEIYQNGFITSHSNQVLERVLMEYVRLANEYVPERFDIYFTKEIREAENFFYIYFRIKSFAPDVRLRILSNDEELELFCSNSELLLSEHIDISTADIMLASINADNINFALTHEGVINYTEQIPYGYIKLSEMVEKITRERTHYSKLLSEIIENKLRLAVSHIGERQLKLISLTTRDAHILSDIFEYEQIGFLHRFSQETIEQAYRSIKEMTPEQLQTKYPKLTEAQSTTIQSTIIVARQLIKTAKTNEIYLIQNDIAETLVQLQFKVTRRKEIKSWIEKGSYYSAVAIGQRYNVDQAHADTIEKYALHLFDALKKRYNLSRRMKRDLRLCSRLLDVGQYGGEEGQAKASQEIINREDIIGLSKEERRVLGRICFNAKTNDYKTTQQTSDFDMDDSYEIAQLTAILKIAAALDQSRRQKISKLSCSLTEDEIIIKITTSHNTQLESYYFNRDSKWMERIFELKPILKVKRIKV